MKFFPFIISFITLISTGSQAIDMSSLPKDLSVEEQWALKAIGNFSSHNDRVKAIKIFLASPRAELRTLGEAFGHGTVDPYTLKPRPQPYKNPPQKEIYSEVPIKDIISDNLKIFLESHTDLSFRYTEFAFNKFVDYLVKKIDRNRIREYKYIDREIEKVTEYLYRLFEFGSHEESVFFKLLDLQITQIINSSERARSPQEHIEFCKLFSKHCNSLIEIYISDINSMLTQKKVDGIMDKINIFHKKYNWSFKG